MIKRQITLTIDEDEHLTYACDPPGVTWDVALGDLKRATSIMEIDVVVAQTAARVQSEWLRLKTGL